MTTEYQGYSSYNQDISQTEEYDIDHELSEDHQKHNHNQTYEEALNFPLYDALNQITNKIKISHALSQNLFHNCELKQSGRIKKYLPLTSRSISKNHISTNVAKNHTLRSITKNQTSRVIAQNQPVKTSRPVNKNQNLPLQKENKKSRSHSLLYFQQNQTINQTPKQATVLKKSKQSKFDLPLQVKKYPKTHQQALTSTYYLPITQQNNNPQHQKPKYFAKNQQNSINTKRQILLTSRSGYNLSISGDFLENITKQYENYQNKDNQITLKEKIQLKLHKDKNQRIKTQYTQSSDLNFHKKSVSKLYKPLNPYETPNQKIILSTEPFENRQQKTLQNKKNKIQQLKEKKLQAEIQQCTFKPKTNISKIKKNIK